MGVVCRCVHTKWTNMYACKLSVQGDNAPHANNVPV